ncbi:MAG: hypothetical protein Q8K51_05750, partial [Nitrospirota bacterium]|nr:hypothetical protein [Nitrospirota bacterium]
MFNDRRLLRVALGEGVEEDMEVVGFNSESKKSWKIAPAMSRPGHRRRNENHQKLFQVGSMALLT